MLISSFFAIFPLIASTCRAFLTDLTGLWCISTNAFALEVHLVAALRKLNYTFISHV